MYSHLLVATDGSKLSEKAVTHAIDLAQRLDARLTFFHVAPEYPSPLYTEGVMMEMMSRKSYVTSVASNSAAILERVAKKAAAAGVACDTHHALSRSPSDAIVAAARKYKCDAIVMGSRGHGGLKAFLIGSVTQKVLAQTKLPVIVAR
jgi:nucleotide-binding universal stress UspA family protein